MGILSSFVSNIKTATTTKSKALPGLTNLQATTLGTLIPPLGVYETIKPGLLAATNPAYKDMSADQIYAAEAAKSSAAKTAGVAGTSASTLWNQAWNEGYNNPTGATPSKYAMSSGGYDIGAGYAAGQKQALADKGKGGGGGTGTGGGSDINTLMSSLANPDLSAYESAKEITAAQLPLIQQRYKSLLDEIKANTGAGVSAYQTGAKEAVSAAQARAGASGTFSSSTEIGQEANINAQAASSIATLENQATTQEEKAAAEENLTELAVAKEIASLGISEAQAQQSGLKDALMAVIEQEKVGIAETVANQTTQTVATNIPSGLFGLLGIGGGTTITTKTANNGTWN